MGEVDARTGPEYRTKSNPLEKPPGEFPQLWDFDFELTLYMSQGSWTQIAIWNGGTLGKPSIEKYDKVMDWDFPHHTVF